MKNKVYIFSNGTQFMDWQASNCERCKKSSFNGNTQFPLNCEIENAFHEALWDDGSVTEEIRERSGYESDKYVWPCNEVDWTEEWKNEQKTANIRTNRDG